MRNLQRWLIVALVCVGVILNYLARNSLGALAPQLETALHFTTAQYSYVVGAFQLAYTVMQPVCGAVIDALGLKLGFALFAIGWSLANMACALAGGWMSLAGFRGLLGLTEAAAVPAGIKVVGAWFQPKERSVAVGWLNAGTSLGALIAGPMALGVSLTLGWRWAFVITGGLGLIWAAAWVLLYRAPEEPAAAAVPVSAADKPRLRDIVGQRAFWAIAIPRFLAEPAWQTFSFWIPLYLAKERGLDLKSIALFAWLPFLAADLGGVLGGYLSPFLAGRFRMDLITSRVAGVGLGAVLMIAPACVGLAAGPYAAIALLCVGGFAHQVISVLINTLSADLFAPRIVATANGFVGMAGWTGGLIFSLIIGALADTVGFTPLFGALGVFDLIGAVVLAVMLRGVRAQDG